MITAKNLDLSKSWVGVSWIPFAFGDLTGTATYTAVRGTYISRNINLVAVQLLAGGTKSGTSGSMSAQIYRDTIEAVSGPSALTATAYQIGLWSGSVTVASATDASYRTLWSNPYSGGSGKYSDKRIVTLFGGSAALKVCITVTGSGTVAFSNTRVLVGYTEDVL